MPAAILRPLGWLTAGLALGSATVTVFDAPTGSPAVPTVAAVAVVPQCDNPTVAPGLVRWHASFEAARGAAARSGRPVLVFHMMGQLDKQFCCSNARLARTVLFSSREVADAINAGFEPVWETVRPAPLVAIDFGNGRVVRRTLHGNIATYVCRPDGTVCDVLPGIYTPTAYLRELGACKALVASLGGPAPADDLRAYHTREVARLDAAMRSPRNAAAVPAMRAVAQTGGGFKGGFNGPGFAGGFGGIGGAPPSANRGGFGGIEGPTERLLMGLPAVPFSVPPGALADRPELVLDTEVNELIRRRAVHEHLARSGAVRPDDLKAWLYKEVLRTDIDDPLLGLGGVLDANYPFADEDRAAAAR